MSSPFISNDANGGGSSTAAASTEPTPKARTAGLEPALGSDTTVVFPVSADTDVAAAAAAEFTIEAAAAAAPPAEGPAAAAPPVAAADTAAVAPSSRRTGESGGGGRTMVVGVPVTGNAPAVTVTAGVDFSRGRP